MKIYFDGSCNPNPNGVARYAYAIFNKEGNTLYKDTGIVCKGFGATNNLAEWSALYYAVKKISCMSPQFINIFGDSLLVINQLNDIQKVKQKNLCDLCFKTKEILNGYVWTAEWISREKNFYCQKLLFPKNPIK